MTISDEEAQSCTTLQYLLLNVNTNPTSKDRFGTGPKTVLRHTAMSV
ncbi:MAG: hypothetical protein AAB467_04660 [Patescibacteria group bacterium]